LILLVNYNAPVIARVFLQKKRKLLNWFTLSLATAGAIQGCAPLPQHQFVSPEQASQAMEQAQKAQAAQSAQINAQGKKIEELERQDRGYRYHPDAHQCLNEENIPGYNPGYWGECGFLTGSDQPSLKIGDSPLNLKGALIARNLTSLDLHGANFEYARFLPGISLENTNFKGANFRGATLSKVNLSGANLEDTDFLNADLSGAIFDRTSKAQDGGTK
jgi:uncharacterized protein YjbI with pentapeptide repeats